MLDADSQRGPATFALSPSADTGLNDEALRVLRVLCTTPGWRMEGAVLPLRRMAASALGGDSARAGVILAALDYGGYVRTRTMGWHFGWVTERGRRAAAGSGLPLHP